MSVDLVLQVSFLYWYQACHGESGSSDHSLRGPSTSVNLELISSMTHFHLTLQHNRLSYWRNWRRTLRISLENSFLV